MAIKRYEGQPLPIVVSFPVNPLTSYGKTYDDITEITMNLKKNLATDTDTQYLQKTQTGGGVLLDQNNHRFTMVINIGDYGNLTAGDVYYLTLNIQVTGIADYLEMDILDREVLITDDANRA